VSLGVDRLPAYQPSIDRRPSVAGVGLTCIGSAGAITSNLPRVRESSDGGGMSSTDRYPWRDGFAPPMLLELGVRDRADCVSM